MLYSVAYLLTLFGFGMLLCHIIMLHVAMVITDCADLPQPFVINHVYGSVTRIRGGGEIVRNDGLSGWM